MKIATKITSYFIIAGIVLSIVASSVFYILAKDILQKEIESRMDLLARVRTAHIESYLDMLKMSVIQLSRSVVFEDFLQSLQKKDSDMAGLFESATLRLKRTKGANPAIYEFMILDVNGKVVASNNELNIGLDKSADSYFLGGRTGVYIKDAYLIEGIKEPLIGVSAPCLSDDNADFLGVIVARVKLNDLYNIVTDRKGLGRTGEVYIVNKYGFMISPSRFKSNTFLKQQIDIENIKKSDTPQPKGYIALDVGQTRIFRDYRGALVLGDYNYIPETKWTVIAEVDAEEAFAPLRILRALFVFIVLFVIVCVSILSIVISNVITRPINKLYEGVKVIGSGNLDYKISCYARDEIGTLCRAFNTMVQDLKNSTVSIDRLNKEIAVRAKTEEEVLTLKQRLDFILSSSKTHIDILDSDFNLVYVDPGWEEIYGDYKGKKCFEYFNNRDTLCPGCGAVEALKTKKNVVSEETLPKENNRPIQVTSVPFQDKSGTWFLAEVNVDITERKLIEASLDENREYFRTTLDSVGDGLIAVDANAAVTFINPVAERLTGWRENEAIGKHIDEVFVIRKENTDEKAENPVLKVLSSGQISKLANHTVLIAKNNVIYAIDDSAAPIIDKKTQKSIGVVLVFRDVTQRNRIEKELRQLSLAVEQSPTCIVVTDIEGNIQYVNPKFVEITGYSAREVLGQNPRVLKSGEQTAEYYKVLWDTITTGNEWHGEFHNKKKNGDMYWERAVISPIKDSEGVITGFIGIKEDITGYKQAQEKLIEVAEQYRTLVENVPGIVYRCANDKEWTMSFISDEIYRLTGYRNADFIDNAVRSYASIIYVEDHDKVNRIIQQALSENKPYSMEYRIHCADGSIVWVQEKGRGVYNPNGDLLWLDGVITDITVLKEAQEQMHVAMQMQMEFTSTVSHELRTPLTAIKEGIAIVLDGSAGDINAEQKDFLDTAKRNVDRLTRLINDVLDFQKLKAGKTRFDMESNDLNETIKDVQKQMSPEANKKGLEFSLDLDKTIPKINFDRDAIARVLINIINNAFKFTDHGSITITTEQRPEENSVYVRAKDTGPGIKESDLGRLFEDFEQLEKGKDRKTGGTGLGLAISKKIVAQHGGRIWAESEEGKGTTLIFVLPIVERRSFRA
jgi:PAS domain S-box-containing protein